MWIRLLHAPEPAESCGSWRIVKDVHELSRLQNLRLNTQSRYRRELRTESTFCE